MLSNSNTQEQKLIQAIELSDAEMEKVSGGDRDLDSETWERTRSRRYIRDDDEVEETWEETRTDRYTREYDD